MNTPVVYGRARRRGSSLVWIDPVRRVTFEARYLADLDLLQLLVGAAFLQANSSRHTAPLATLQGQVAGMKHHAVGEHAQLVLGQAVIDMTRGDLEALLAWLAAENESLARAKGGDQPDSAPRPGTSKTPAAGDSLCRVAALGGGAVEPPQRGLPPASPGRCP